MLNLRRFLAHVAHCAHPNGPNRRFSALKVNDHKMTEFGPPKQQIPDADLGITSVLLHGHGFRGHLKSRWADFIVREVSTDNVLAKLTNQSTAIADVQAPIQDTASQSIASLDTLRAIIGADLLCAIEALALPASQHSQDTVSIHAPSEKQQRTQVHQLVRQLYGPGLDTENREAEGGAKVIVVFRQDRVKQKAAADSSASGASSNKRPREDDRDSSREAGRGSAEPAIGTRWKRTDWPRDRPNFLRFVLHKQNVDTVTAVRLLADKLGTKEKNVGYAGAKDKRGVTSQFMTLYRMHPQRLLGVARNLQGISVGNFEFVGKELKLGDLKGNNFTIVLRNLSMNSSSGASGSGVASASASSAAVPSASSSSSREPTSSVSPIDIETAVRSSVEAWISGGCKFINYFGRQRFGIGDAGAGTHNVGKAMLRQDWVTVVRLMLARREGEPEGSDVAAAKAAFEAGDIRTAIQRMPRYMGLELSILRILQEKGGLEANGAARDAVSSLPPHLRSLFAHAYQSRLWNRAATARLEQLGSNPVVGDLVLVDASSVLDVDMTEDNEVAPEAGADAVDIAGASAAGASAGSGSAADGAPSTFAPASWLPAVRVLTESDVSSGRYGIQDVILPVPGCAVAWPTHAAGLNLIAELLAADGFPVASGAESSADSTIPATPSASSAVDAHQRVLAAVSSVFSARDKRFVFAGDYRKVVGVAQDVSWEWIPHAAPTQDVTTTDWQEMQAGRRRGGASASAGSSSADPATGSGAAASNSSFPPAVKLSFTLGRSSYATMAMREVLKS